MHAIPKEDSSHPLQVPTPELQSAQTGGARVGSQASFSTAGDGHLVAAVAVTVAAFREPYSRLPASHLTGFPICRISGCACGVCVCVCVRVWACVYLPDHGVIISLMFAVAPWYLRALCNA